MAENHTDDGGPAFPNTYWLDQAEFRQDGMSLRDHFAAHAMRAMIQQTLAQCHGDYKETAFKCYQLADFMLAERKRRAEGDEE